MLKTREQLDQSVRNDIAEVDDWMALQPRHHAAISRGGTWSAYAALAVTALVESAGFMPNPTPQELRAMPLVWRTAIVVVGLLGGLASILKHKAIDRDGSVMIATASALQQSLHRIKDQLAANQVCADCVAREYDWIRERLDFIWQGAWAHGHEDASGSFVNGSEIRCVDGHIRCDGSVKSLKRGVHVWLVVHIDGNRWPKDAPLHPDVKGRFTTVIEEFGKSECFEVQLVAASARGHCRILRWLDASFDSYPPIGHIPAARTLATMRCIRRGTI